MEEEKLTNTEKISLVKQIIKDAVGSDYEIIELIEKIIYDK